MTQGMKNDEEWLDTLLRKHCINIKSQRFDTGWPASEPKIHEPTESIDELKAAILDKLNQAVVGAIQNFVKDFQSLAIPETNDYANGWNDCRQQIRQDLNRLAELTSSRQEDK